MWHYLIRPCRNARGWIGMAKREPFIGSDAIAEPGELWFEFGATEAEARHRIEAEVRRLSI